MSRYLVSVVLILFSLNVFSAEGWSGSNTVVAIDSLPGSSPSFTNKVFVSLEGYSNPSCSNNRIAVYATDTNKFDQMFSMVLSAMHSGSKINFYFPDTSTCDSNRIIITK